MLPAGKTKKRGEHRAGAPFAHSLSTGVPIREGGGEIID